MSTFRLKCGNGCGVAVLVTNLVVLASVLAQFCYTFLLALALAFAFAFALALSCTLGLVLAFVVLDLDFVVLRLFLDLMVLLALGHGGSLAAWSCSWSRSCYLDLGLVWSWPLDLAVLFLCDHPSYDLCD